jgi:hypothetical protein
VITEIEAIKNLIPNSEWHYSEGVLTVFTEGVIAPTEKEIEQEKQRLSKMEAEIEAEAQAKKAAAEAKLVALGFTADDLKALGL